MIKPFFSPGILLSVKRKSEVIRSFLTMAEVKPKSRPFEVEYPEGVPYSAWNFNIYTMLTMVRKTCFGKVKTDLSNLLLHLLPGTTKELLEKSTCLELDNCFLANQRFEAERVGSMPEDVPVIQPIIQPVEAEGREEIMRDVGCSFECDYNLCFKDISASERILQNPESDSSTMPEQLRIVPSNFLGHVELEVQQNADLISGLQNLCVANQGRRLLSSELLIEQMYNVLTIITAILNVHRIKNHHKSDNKFKDKDNISLSHYLQYVGQAGPAVHVVMCMSDIGQKGMHLFLTEDVSLSVPCNEWPSCAMGWINREKPSGWPSQQLIDKVLQDGCHVVPKFEGSDRSQMSTCADNKERQDACHDCDPKSTSNGEITCKASKMPRSQPSQKSKDTSNTHQTPNEENLVPIFDTSQKCSEASRSNAAEMAEDAQSKVSPPKTLWRYSFSFAEKTLMTSITEEQKICYLIFKYLFSKYVKLHSVITTYTAKTIFLWKLETVPPDQWSLQLIGDRVKDLVEELRTCVKKKYCQHYFISGLNVLQKLDDESRNKTVEVGFSLLDEQMADAPVLGSEVFEAPSGFPADFMFTYKSFYTINAWLESLNAQMLAKLDPPSKIPSEKTMEDFLDSSKTHPIVMSEILKYLVVSEEIYGQSLPVPQSLLQHQKVKQLIKFLEKSITTAVKYQECMRELDIELKFLHLQFKVIDEIEQFFTDNPSFAFKFASSSDESDAEDNN